MRLGGTSIQRRTAPGLAAVLVLLLAVAPLRDAAGAEPDAAVPAHAPGEVIVRWRPGVSAAARAAAGARAGAALDRAMRLPRTEVLRLAPGGSVAEAVRALERLPEVASAQPNLRYTAALVPDDPRFGDQWALDNTGQTGGTAGADVGAPDAWDVTTGAGVVVAVVDSGADLSHPDLAGAIWTNPGETGTDSHGVNKRTNGVDDDGNGLVDDWRGWDWIGAADPDNDPEDENGHGTHVAGILAARGNNATGIAGMSWGAKLMVLRVLNASGSGWTDDIADAILYARDKGASIANVSLGAGSNDPVLEAAVDASPGVLIVAAAGNAGTNLDDGDTSTASFYPCAYPADHVVCVGATNADDALASFSNYGTTSVDLAAPGAGIVSTLMNGTYGLMSGTSMAAPHVSGAAALIAGEIAGSTPASMRAQILDAVQVVPALSSSIATSGRLDAFTALGLPRAVPAITPEVGVAPLTAMFDSTGSFDPNGSIVGVEWDFGGGDVVTDTTFERTYPEIGRFFVTLTVTDDDGNTRSAGAEVAAGIDFVDDDGSLFETAIVWLSAARITGGCSTTHYCPDKRISRGEMATFLVKAFGLPPAATDFFSDDDGTTHEANINALAASGITGGCAAGRYCPGNPVTRAQMAAFLARALGLPPTPVDYFTDDDGHSLEARINAFRKAGLTAGCNKAGTRYCPENTVTRAQMASFLRNALT